MLTQLSSSLKRKKMLIRKIIWRTDLNNPFLYYANLYFAALCFCRHDAKTVLVVIRIYFQTIVIVKINVHRSASDGLHHGFNRYSGVRPVWICGRKCMTSYSKNLKIHWIRSVRRRPLDAYHNITLITD